MPDNLSVLSDSDVAALRDIIARVKRSHGPRGGDLLDASDLDYLTPEVYLAQAPASGLPAASSSGVLGVADCQIYRTLPFSGGASEALGYSKTVYNPGASAVAAGTLFLATRDKFGVWYCGAVSASGLGQVVNLVTNVCPVYTSGTGSGSGAGGNYLTGLTVERTTVTIPGAVTGAVYCTTPAAKDCCPLPKVSVPCNPDMMPQTLYLTVSGITLSACGCLAGTYTMTWAPGGVAIPGGNMPGWQTGDINCPVGSNFAGAHQTFAVVCISGGGTPVWQFWYLSTGGQVSHPISTTVINPFQLSGRASVSPNYGCFSGLTGYYNWTVTE